MLRWVYSAGLLRGSRGSQLCLQQRTGVGIYPASTPCLSGATLNPERDAQLGSAQPPTPPSRDSAFQLPLDKAGLPKPGTTPLATSPQCAANRELVSPAEAPIILSSPRTSKTDSYDLVWRPRPDSRAPILYYVVKHRKVSLFHPAPIFPLRRSTGGLVASLHVFTPHEQMRWGTGTRCSLVVLVGGTSSAADSACRGVMRTGCERRFAKLCKKRP